MLCIRHRQYNVTRESAGNPFERISGARAFSHVQRLSLDPAEPRSADSPLAGQHQSYKSNSDDGGHPVEGICCDAPK